MDGGTIGLTEDEKKFRHWGICSSEVATATVEFGIANILKGNKNSEFNHHEDVPSFQEKFSKQLNPLVKKLEQLGPL